MSELTTVEELVADANLTNVAFFELSAQRQTSPSTDPENANEAPELGAQHTVILERRDDGHGFRVRLKTEVTPGSLGSIVAGVEGEWDTPTIEQGNVPEDVMLEYINGVAIMVLMPFTREAIADITRRVFGSALLMPVMQRGTVQFTSLGQGVPAEH